MRTTLEAKNDQKIMRTTYIRSKKLLKIMRTTLECKKLPKNNAHYIRSKKMD